MRDEPLRVRVVLVDAGVRVAQVEDGQRPRWTHTDFDHEGAARLQITAAFSKQAVCASCVVRLLIVLKTR